MFDVFYFGEKPGAFPHERRIDDIDDAYALSRTRMFWVITADADYSEFDFSWEPTKWETQQRHTWRSQWQKTSGTYLYPKGGYQDTHYRTDQRVLKRSALANWDIPPDLDTSSFDFSWHPNYAEPPYIYQFGTKWNKGCGPRYKVPGATQVKYISYPVAKALPSFDNWEIPADVDATSFDFSWRPDPTDPPLIYQFGTKWNKGNGPRYVVPGATQVKYVVAPVAKTFPSFDNWEIPTDIAIDSFDFSWKPDPTAPPYIYQFGTKWQKTGGPRYIVPGATQVKYVAEPRAARTTVDQGRWEILADTATEDFDFSWHPDAADPPYIYQFGTQWQRTGGPRYIVPGATQVKYVAEPRSTKTAVDAAHWETPDSAKESGFDYTWHPDATEPPFIYQFGTQWQRTGGPRYIVPGATQVKYVQQVRAVSKPSSSVPVIFIDHFNSQSATAKETVASKVAIAKSTRFIDNYLSTLRRIAASLPADTEHVWIVSSVCDYSDFDFSWHPSDWQRYMLHVFASGNQKFGDTFYMHVPTFRTGIESVELLDWYDLNFVEGISVPRLPVPVVQHSEDTNSVAVTKSVVTDPLTIFTTSGHLPDKIPAVPLWRDKTRAVTPLTKTGSTVIVPRDAIGNINSQLWDYPYVDTKLAAIPEAPLDIVFISNGEPHADKNWEHLNSSLQGKPNRVVRVDGVNGRVAAYQAAAAMSSTPWFLAVFAKLRVNPDFDWAWTPDYLQAPKHYIFHAKNPVNGLEYGHQAMIAYNKRMCFENTGAGLDFTMDQLHEVIPELSGVAEYNVDPWTTWRTAFREVLKLRQIAETSPDYAVKHRLAKWQEPADSSIRFGEWSHKGAVDAIQYYDSVNGEFAKLKLSYEWEWLSKFYTARYPA